MTIITNIKSINQYLKVEDFFLKYDSNYITNWQPIDFFFWMYLLSGDSENFFHPHRRLQLRTPSWGDFLVVAGLAWILWYLLRIIQAMNAKWKKMMKTRIGNG
jgi:hypothetical protein